MTEPKVISNFAIFSGVSLNYLAEISKHAEIVEYASGDTVFEAGDEASRLYGVISGEVELVLVARDNLLKTDVQYEEYSHSQVETIERQISVDSIGPGEIFGWSALSPAGQYTSKAVCSEPTKLFAVDATVLKSFFSKYPQIGYPFMERLASVISNRMANRTDKLIEGWVEAFAVNRI